MLFLRRLSFDRHLTIGRKRHGLERHQLDPKKTRHPFFSRSRKPLPQSSIFLLLQTNGCYPWIFPQTQQLVFGLRGSRTHLCQTRGARQLSASPTRPVPTHASEFDYRTRPYTQYTPRLFRQPPKTFVSAYCSYRTNETWM